MPGSLERPEIAVEGQDDEHVIKHLLRRYEVDFDRAPQLVALPRFTQARSVESLTQSITLKVKLSNNRSVGFVLDADEPLANRWASVRDRLKQVGVATPAEAPPEGFIGYSDEYRARVGVWLMPDNQHDGNLETFLRELIEDRDHLIGHAETATAEAKTRGAVFSDGDRPKAILHTWLAWQERPGVPYGTAIRAKYFRHDSPAAEAFVAWFKCLYGIE